MDNKKTIGASQAAAILGYSPYPDANPVSIWKKIMGYANDEPSEEGWQKERKMIGNLLEDDIYTLYTGRTGRQVIATQVRKERDFLHATIDGLTSDNMIVEAKSSVVYMTELPIYYRIQVLIQMYVHEVFRAEVAMLGGMYFKIFAVEYNEKEVQSYVEKLRWFYDTYVVTGVCPPAVTQKMFRKKNELSVLTLDADLRLLYERYAELSKQHDEVERQLQELKTAIKNKVPVGHSVVDNDRVLMNRYLVKGRVDVNKSLLADKYPEVFEEVSVKQMDYDRLVVYVHDKDEISTGEQQEQGFTF